ncbi:hypothetical protein [Microbacterium istanbulense]|uniref:D-inositol 3-phosphate glycosyltransferase n=1 Tax=Microbacterium istanbulense TaxID=3122049 RepID=A0ABU8LJE8_9MICO
MAKATRVLHLNDCAFVGRNLVRVAQNQGRPWRLLPPERTWPPVRPGRTTPTRAASYSTIGRVALGAGWADVVHVHYATTVARLLPPYVPNRPYVLHLHGTDIRTLWRLPERHATIQRYIDGAAHVYFSTPDNEANAVDARPDAEYLPVVIDETSLPPWRPSGYVAFASRWEQVKGLEDMLNVAARLLRAGVEVRGLDWGPGAAEARQLGVKLIPKAPHATYLDFLAGANVVVGQATRILSVSELEAMAIGAPVAAVGHHFPGPDGRPLPIRNGDLDTVVDAILSDMSDPVAAATTLASREWTLHHHVPARQLDRLQATYDRIRGGAPLR